ncbi:ricin B lectin domain-containing protein [Coprinopsis sp. MPI-PUGE-AT-0042]|nr:ricin B lectin domain-containing protein [Coprinopsis sp. MPI-PUGE-AT-0042]
MLTSALALLASGLIVKATSPIPPLEQGGTIHPNADGRKCVEVRGGVLANGTPVQIYPAMTATAAAAQQWVFTRNQAGTPIRLANTNFCLDAGDNPFQPNGNQMKIWDSDGSIDTDGTIKLSDVRYAQWGERCLDITDGRLENTNVLQTWGCSPSNTNQLWRFQQPIVFLPPVTTSSSPLLPALKTTPSPVAQSTAVRPAPLRTLTPSSHPSPLCAMLAPASPPLPLPPLLLSLLRAVNTPVSDALLTAAPLAPQELSPPSSLRTPTFAMRVPASLPLQPPPGAP